VWPRFSSWPRGLDLGISSSSAVRPHERWRAGDGPARLNAGGPPRRAQARRHHHYSSSSCVNRSVCAPSSISAQLRSCASLLSLCSLSRALSRPRALSFSFWFVAAGVCLSAFLLFAVEFLSCLFVSCFLVQQAGSNHGGTLSGENCLWP
jgi:hypothetical protein